MSTGTYTFHWEHANASDVWVTGTFDDWKKTIQLEKKGDIFEKTVDLPTGQKFLYKFVVDGAWILDDTKPKETDSQFITNNVLHPSDIKEKPSLAAAAISTVGPNATTTTMVGNLPKEESSVPGAFPETPAAEAEKAFSVNPIPASDGVGNPVSLPAGAAVPAHHELTSNTLTSNVKTDKESYENADAGAAKNIFNETNAAAPPHPIGKVIIPESSLPVENNAGVTPFISSAGAGTTTAEKAGGLPKEPEVPNVVVESQAAAHVDPEASANPVAVQEKKEVESELKSKVHEEPAASTGGFSAGGIAAGVTGAAAAAGAAITGAAYATKEKAVETAAPAVNAVTGSSTTTPAVSAEPAATVPPVVAESIEKSHQGAEAAANPIAVEEKKEVEAQLLKEVKQHNETGEPAPTTSAATPLKASEPTAPVVAESATPKKEAALATDAGLTPASDKKSKRQSIMIKFDKIKHKIFKD